MDSAGEVEGAEEDGVPDNSGEAQESQPASWIPYVGINMSIDCKIPTMWQPCSSPRTLLFNA